MGLKEFVIAGVATLAAAGADVVMGEESPKPEQPKVVKKIMELQPADVNSHLRALMQAGLPHVVDHQAIITKNARRAVIIVLQCHWSHGLTEKEIQEVEASQAELYELIEALQKGEWIDSVHCEAVMAAGEPAPDPEWAFDPEKVEPEKKISSVARFGAAKTLADRGVIVMKGAERTKAFNASGPALSMPAGEERFKLLFADREDGFFSVLDAENDAVACGKWGADHEFIASLDRHNLDALDNNRPEKLTSMVIITTTAVRNRMLRMRREEKAETAKQLVTPSPQTLDPKLFGTPKKKPKKPLIPRVPF